MGKRGICSPSGIRGLKMRDRRMQPVGTLSPSFIKLRPNQEKKRNRGKHRENKNGF